MEIENHISEKPKVLDAQLNIEESNLQGLELWQREQAQIEAALALLNGDQVESKDSVKNSLNLLQ